MLTRIGRWLGVWVLLTVVLIWMTVAESQRHLPIDPSSMAWVGFLPFLLPLFFLQTAIYLAPCIVIVEIVLWFYRK